MPVDTSIYAPRPHPNMIETLGGIAGAARSVIGVQQDKFNLAHSHLDFMRSQFSSLLSKPDLDIGDFQDLAVNGVKEGVWTPQEAAAELAMIKDTSPQGLKQAAQQFLMQTMSATEQLNAAMGVPQQTNTGSEILQQSVSPLTGVHQLGPNIPVQMSPSELATPTQIGTLPGGEAQMGTRGDFLERTGHPPVNRLEQAAGANVPQAPPASASPGETTAAPGETTAAPGVMPSPASDEPIGAGVDALPDDAAANLPDALPPGAAVAANAIKPPGVVIGLPAGRAEAMQLTAAEAANQANDLSRTANQIPQQRATLQNLEQFIDKFPSGPGADDWKTFKAFANRVSPIGDLFDPSTIASQEEFNKQAANLAQQQFAAIGGTGTDAKLDSAMHTSPSDFLSNLGNQGILHLLKGNLDALAIKNREWLKWMKKGNPVESYQQFTADFMDHFDPRVFQSVYMSPAERQSMFKAMTEPERQTFGTMLREAIDKGWVSKDAFAKSSK